MTSGGMIVDLHEALIWAALVIEMGFMVAAVSNAVRALQHLNPAVKEAWWKVWISLRPRQELLSEAGQRYVERAHRLMWGGFVVVAVLIWLSTIV